MDIRKLTYFKEVVEKGSFAAAAREINISVQGLNKSIHQLEDELGVALFDYTASKLVLTQYGEFLYNKALAVVHANNDILNGLEQLKRNYENRLEIIFQSGAFNLFPKYFIPDFIIRNPDIDVNLTSLTDEEVNRAVHTTENAIVIFATSEVPENYSCIYTKTGKLFLIAGSGHRFAKRGKIKFKELDGENLINVQFRNTQHNMNARFTRLGIRPKYILTNADRNLTMSLVQNNLAVAFHAGVFYKNYENIVRVDFEDFDDNAVWKVLIPDRIADTEPVKRFAEYADRILNNKQN